MGSLQFPNMGMGLRLTAFGRRSSATTQPRSQGVSTFPAHTVEELPCGSQPPAPKCVVWSWRLKEFFAPVSTVKGRLHRAFVPVAARRLCLTRPKQLSMAGTALAIWLCACVRYWPGRGLVFECVTCLLLLFSHLAAPENLKVALNPMYRIFLNFAKSCILSCLSKLCNKKKFQSAVFER